MKLYLAGPMRAYPEFNHPAFRKATALLRADGHEVFSPAEHDEVGGFDFTGMAGTPEDLDAQGFDLRVALADDLVWICGHAEGLVVLPGWQTSLGATAEVATARALSLPVWPLAEFVLYGDTGRCIAAGAAL
ncbi:DUF4406 domain-containing protein [Actinomadura sp. DC4]|uniref:DUF4406 domain-containing protein n=1 Tax=Actinomadura sp. DC4 TaxID=3055069 RepID=UPI0025B14BB8|nr:DUF4406 domain-containing protein [Actinomadura sp. DC4]MDN3356036.1 DUF4406 domain-containing protein [Actinomadura sp. DC4]